MGMERNPQVARWLEFLPTFKNPWAHARRQRAESLSLVAAQIFDITELGGFSVTMWLLNNKEQLNRATRCQDPHVRQKIPEVYMGTIVMA